MIHRAGFMSLPLLAAPFLALALLPAAGCSDDPESPQASVDNEFSEAELATMRKSVKTHAEFRELKRIKLAERAGSATVKTKSSAGSRKSN